MSSMIVRFDSAAGARWGLLVSEAPTRPQDEIRVVEIDTTATTTGQLLSALENGLKLPSGGEGKSMPAKSLLSPVTTDATLVCQGVNYATHAQETGAVKRKRNLFFNKASSSLTGPYSDIVRPPEVELLDYEVEVGIVLRRDLKAGDVVTPERLGEFISAVVLCNDISARDTMFGALTLQWYQGKSYRTFCPTGPVLYWLEPAEVASTFDKLEFTLSYQDSVRQSASPSEMIHKPADTLTQLAAIMDLKAGDMILTGTPGGVLLGHGSPARMLEIITQNMMDDDKRRDEFREHLKSKVSFLQPGDTMSLTLRDGHAQRALGGQFSRVVQG
ncbi:2-keto-4-pentenoate hydratase/2-oxohepta-3-ene-1,7-dioic acid hydratase (catechol pathway) [Variovorax sp. HW608]|uniref:fumarylacetoacetate hydrolase family protein n=1 Tax=Variovorax sp. HW608 TaxID=1034889 RepID=UPI00081FECC3|nr:fumarylacetoacetate hydrolase family protein [Variovorax sp. HW608]SCK14092.1 2-keto-4-pentenoate hydratase/2-oxohepta-3-ene-1,7-dioic acid hydratase (catechol pathway) [Variovorax sp. HW608]SCK14618.1 2-keto-4-pentenoate hydratase/2-oxohepta-3-ene-1,7-dioic acid hydratase (catechol pathway) [Variovorax sp. HW608]